MAAPARKKIVVAGGNGFLGSRICKYAVARGWQVTSLSRSGEPSWRTVSASDQAPSWSNEVEWVKADVVRPATYRAHLEKADAAVHTMGILLEADYKGAISGKESPIAGLRRAFSSTKAGSSRNPLDKTPDDEGIGIGERDGQITYELMNRDTAISLAKEASLHQVPTFVYISAAAGAPMLPTRYITTKREAEDTISKTFPDMRSIFYRPGLLWDSSRGFTVPIMAAGMIGNTVNEWLFRGALTSIIGAAVEKPLKADLVAQAVVEGIAEDSVRGIQKTRQIEDLAAKAWRREML